MPRELTFCLEPCPWTLAPHHGSRDGGEAKILQALCPGTRHFVWDLVLGPWHLIMDLEMGVILGNFRITSPAFPFQSLTACL
ncbi:hypothetical protein X975_03764, partial [Stegodyphus mimosarum]